MSHPISITAQQERTVQDTKSLPFGKIPTEHMFIAEYKDGTWQNSRIVPFGDLVLSPFTLALHYGQTVFEGMKAFKTKDGKVNLFRPEKHYDRFTKSLQRMCMPSVPHDMFISALHELIKLDSNWIPEDEDGALYIRPFMIASEDRIGVKVSDEYLFMVVASPAYQYYAQPLKVKIETQYSRAADGGTGSAKCGGNYGAAFYPTQLAKEEGYDQVIWTDSRFHEFIEESGTMNLMFHIDNTLITPPLSGTILDGVTRDSMLTIAKEKGINVAERPLTLDEVITAFENGKRVEAFGAGTAAVVAPIAVIAVGHKEYQCYTGEDALMYQLKNELHEIRKGLKPDTHHWNYVI
jgi:branched-chain amino acid aminotransferase